MVASSVSVTGETSVQAGAGGGPVRMAQRTRIAQRQIARESGLAGTLAVKCARVKGRLVPPVYLISPNSRAKISAKRVFTFAVMQRTGRR